MRTHRLAVSIALALTVGFAGCAQHDAQDAREDAQPSARELASQDTMRGAIATPPPAEAGPAHAHAPAANAAHDARKVSEAGADTVAPRKIEEVDALYAVAEPEAMAVSVVPVGAAEPLRYGAENTENYAPLDENGVMRVTEQPVSTFSIDVDTGAYSNVRRMLVDGVLPPGDAVRTEESSTISITAMRRRATRPRRSRCTPRSRRRRGIATATC